MLKKTTLLAIVFVMAIADGFTADAALLRRRRQRSTTGNTVQTGQLSINSKGGFDGKLTDAQYQNYFVQQGIAQPLQQQSNCPNGICQLTQPVQYQQHQPAQHQTAVSSLPFLQAQVPQAVVVEKLKAVDERIDNRVEDRMERLLVAMEKKLGVPQNKPAKTVNELLTHLPTVRIQIISHDGKQVEQADIDIESVVLKMIAQSKE